MQQGKGVPNHRSLDRKYGASFIESEYWCFLRKDCSEQHDARDTFSNPSSAMALWDGCSHFVFSLPLLGSGIKTRSFTYLKKKFQSYYNTALLVKETWVCFFDISSVSY